MKKFMYALLFVVLFTGCSAEPTPTYRDVFLKLVVGEYQVADDSLTIGLFNTKVVDIIDPANPGVVTIADNGTITIADQKFLLQEVNSGLWGIYSFERGGVKKYTAITLSTRNEVLFDKLGAVDNKALLGTSSTGYILTKSKNRSEAHHNTDEIHTAQIANPLNN